MADRGYRAGEVHRHGYQARRRVDGDYNGALPDDDDRADLDAPMPRKYERIDRPPAPDRSADLIGGPEHQALVRDLYSDTRG